MQGSKEKHRRCRGGGGHEGLNMIKIFQTQVIVPYFSGVGHSHFHCVIVVSAFLDSLIKKVDSNLDCQARIQEWVAISSSRGSSRPRDRTLISCIGTIPWRRKWQPPPVFLPGKSHGQRILVGYSPQGCKELDTT